MGKRQPTPDDPGSDPEKPCALCLRHLKLCNSHIVPESCYRPAYDSRHCASELRSWDTRWRPIQVGKRERLLCEECDTKRIGRYDTYFKGFWFDRPALPPVISGRTVDVTGADYTLLKLFHLSVLWRAGVSSQAGFSNVKLGPYGEKLRAMLLRGDPGPEDAYPIWGTVILMDDRSVAYELVCSPLGSRLESFTVYCMCYAGCEWNFLVNDHVTGPYLMFCLKKNAPLQLAARSWKDINSLRGRFSSPLPRKPRTPFQ
ncbi:MAG TPA: hypothetical protein VNE39_19515 [Planctomycetota bacterium]|nr:hypothetical protein [Planctomycetota bacterium]